MLSNFAPPKNNNNHEKLFYQWAKNAQHFRESNDVNVHTKDILRKYKSLSEDEKDFIVKHPMTSFQFYNNSVKAENAASKFGGLTNGYGDAIRHCYWCALNKMDAGKSSTLAEEYGDAHENKPNNFAKEMDLHNNSVGYSLGIKAIENEWSDEELLKNVIKAADDGILQIGY